MRAIGWVLALLLLLPAQDRPSSRIIDAESALRDLQVLSADDMQGRRTGTPGNMRARAYIARRFSESGLKPHGNSWLQTFQGGANVIGIIEGSESSGRVIVVTAHYDHLGIRGGRIYNGADDNASGVAGLIALVGYFRGRPPRNGMIFAALDAEETSGAGGRTFVESPPVDRSNIIMNVNLDMIARAADNKLFAAGTYHYPQLQPFIDAVAARAPVDLIRGHDRPDQPGVEDWTADSDHVWFHRAKIPFIYFGVEDFEQHHQPTDDFESITPVFFIHAIETVADALQVFDANLEAIRP
jgi:Zn-dependent M28 family amino/carboxypeptidase